MFLTLLYFTYYGVACVAVTPNLMMAAIISGAFYGLMNLFAGFVMPKPEFPGWWIWVSNPLKPFIQATYSSNLLKAPSRKGPCIVHQQVCSEEANDSYVP